MEGPWELLLSWEDWKRHTDSHCKQRWSADTTDPGEQPDSYPVFVRTEGQDGGDSNDWLTNEYLYPKDVYKMVRALEPHVPKVLAQIMMEE